MNKDCSIVQDLLPLYAEDMLREETKEFVDAHLAQCEACRAELAALKADVKPAPVSAQPLRDLKRQLRRRKLTAVLLAVGVPFFLPHMHDRYFFAADMLTLLLAVAAPEYLLLPVLCEFASLLGYHAYLRMRYLLPMADGALALIAALVILTVVLALELRQRSPLNGKIKKST